MKKLHIHLADSGGCAELTTIKNHDYELVKENAYELAKYLSRNANGKFMDDFLECYLADLYGDHHANILPMLGVELESLLHKSIGPAVYKHISKAIREREREMKSEANNPKDS